MAIADVDFRFWSMKFTALQQEARVLNDGASSNSAAFD